MVLAGGVPSVLTPPTEKMTAERFRAALSATLAAHREAQVFAASSIVTRLDVALRDAAEGRLLTLPPPASLAAAAPRPGGVLTVASAPTDAPFLFQQSSGTTGRRKGLFLSEWALCGHLERYGRAIALNP